MDQYAEIVKQRGVFLEIVDAELFSRMASVYLQVIVDRKDPPMELQHSTQFWSTLVPGLSAEPDPDVRDHCSWVIISCSATYDQDAESRNHWCPGWFKCNISADAFFDLTVLRRSENSKTIRELTKQKRTLDGRLDAMGSRATDSVKIQLLSELEDVNSQISKFLVMQWYPDFVILWL